MNDAELKDLSAQVKRLTARVEALERVLERIIQQKPVSERQLERALRSMKRPENVRRVTYHAYYYPVYHQPACRRLVWTAFRQRSSIAWNARR